MNVDAIFAKKSSGPFEGMGATPHGRPFTGIAEDLPRFWISWLVDTAKAAGVNPASVRLAWYGVELAITPVKVGFGTRYYFRCPRCDRRCEAVYRAGGAVGCVKCLHIGYKSQTTRSTSKWAMLDALLNYDKPQNERWHIPAATLAALARGFEAALTAGDEPELTISLEGGE